MLRRTAKTFGKLVPAVAFRFLDSFILQEVSIIFNVELVEIVAVVSRTIKASPCDQNLASRFTDRVLVRGCWWCSLRSS